MTTELIAEPESITFRSLDLIPPLIEALDFAGYKTPSPIQAALIPIAKTGRDVIGQAQTGTGKTAAFLLPFMNSWRGGDPRKPQAIVLEPTRELAMQVAAEAQRLSPSKYFQIVTVYGGQPMPRQINALQKGCTLIVGTPGRVFDLMQRGNIHLGGIRYVVLDEADRMLDIGFRPQIERIMKQMPEKRQTLLMSATLPPIVLRLAERYMQEPQQISTMPTVMTVDKIEQRYIVVDEDRKFDLLIKWLERQKPRQCIIFMERKRWADRLYKQLKPVQQRTAVIHGDLAQSKREKIMAYFREAKITYLIATDVMSRGIDVSGLSHIVNFDLPVDLENYVHRIGRTGRMGKDGMAVSFVTPEQGKILTAIENMINRLILEDRIEGFEAFAPRTKAAAPAAEKPKSSEPAFGRRSKKYSNRL